MSLPLTGFLSDRWGRRPVFLIAVFNTAWLGLVRYFANTYTGFLILELVEAAVGSGAYSSTYILRKFLLLRVKIFNTYLRLHDRSKSQELD